MYSVYRYARAGERFRLRSRWMLVFDAIRYGWRRFQARLHGHEHVEPLEMSSYGARTSFGVGMIHGVGAETGTQVLLIAAVGGASSAGLGVPMLFAFVLGLLISNFAIVLLSSVSFVSSQAREQLYVAIGAVAGLFSLFVGTIFLFGLDGALPDLGSDPPVLTDGRSTVAAAGSRTGPASSWPAGDAPTSTTASDDHAHHAAPADRPGTSTPSAAASPSVAWRIDRNLVPSSSPDRTPSQISM